MEMSVDWGGVLTGITAFLVALVLKALLDFRLAPLLVKYMHWIPVRTVFRSNPIDISGKWEHLWVTLESEKYKNEIDRHSHTEIKQMGAYCYAEFYSKGDKYLLFGRITDGYLVGDWHDAVDRTGYFGAFQVQVINKCELSGRWIGHSKTIQSIRGGEWLWKKLPE
ncbi:MAG: hypothetical protein ABW166_07535 [Sedimenticola sp.]